MRIAKTALGVVLGSLLLSSASAFGATAPVGGSVKVFITPSPNPNGSGGGTIVLTGAIGDYGKTEKVNAAGKPDKKGTDNELLLKKGTILVNLAQVRAAGNSAQPSDYNPATCSATIVFTAPVTIVSGTKLYAGITGTVPVTETEAFVLPFKKNGTCNMNANPVAAWATVIGGGTVSFGELRPAS
jgi:hypothetical protein